MAANRCSTCGINYPTEGHLRCYGCGRKTDPVSNVNPSEDWKEASTEVRTAIERNCAALPLITPITARVLFRDEHYFISSWDVCRGGFQSNLTTDSLIRIGKQVFEVGGYSDTRREYWLILHDLDEPDTVGPDAEEEHVSTQHDVQV